MIDETGGDGAKNCSVHNCGAEVMARGFCAKHYRRWRIHGDPMKVMRQHENGVSERARTAARANLVKAMKANSLRPSTAVTKTCPTCGKPFKVKKSHEEISTFCTRACQATAYKTQMRGNRNPNYKNVLGKFCQQCGKRFESYIKSRKFCTHVCYQLSIPSMIERLGRSGIDENQKSIVDALRSVGVSVLITSHVGRGFPDLIAGYAGINTLLEVKNPDNAYGKRGFNKNQQAWADEWLGGAPIIVRTVEEAFAAVGVV